MKKGFLILIFLSITFFTALSYIVIAGSGDWWPQCGVNYASGGTKVVGGTTYICCDVQGTGYRWSAGSSCPCWDTGLGSPVVNPSSPKFDKAFQISCPTNGQKQYDCIDAYSNDYSNQCGWVVGSIATFNCAGLSAATYTARCNLRTGTGSNCCAGTTTTSYTVQPCVNHDECSQACTSLCPVGVYGCCFGCMLGQCQSGSCVCVDGTSYCADYPNYQVGSQCYYQATFSQTGIPAGTTWGVTVGGTMYTSTSSSLTVSGLSRTVAYSYDDPASGGAGTRYDCTSGCSGSVTPSSRTATASYTTQYYLTTQVNPASGGTVSSVSGWYNVGTPVNIFAIANVGYTFWRWSGGGGGSYTGTNNPATVTMNSPITETANFNISVTITSLPTGSGYVVVDGSPIATPRTYSWIAGSTHTLSANSPVSCGVGCQYVYSSWSDGGAQSHSITVTSPGAYTSNFQLQYYLTMQISPAGSGWIFPVSGWRNVGTPVNIFAIANVGYTFWRWSGGGGGSYTGTNNPATVTMNSPITETANFNISVTITSLPTGSGYVVVDGSPIATPRTYSWIAGSTHTLSANSPVSCGVGCQYVYSSWSDGGAQSHSITVTSPGAYTSNFQLQYYLTMLANPATGGTLTPVSSWHNVGTPVNILATSLGSCMFFSWTGSGTVSYSGINNPSSVTMNSPITETVEFDCGTANSINFTGYLNYSNGQPVKNSLIKMTIKNSTLGYGKSGIDQTNQYGFFFVKIINIPDVIMVSNLDISIYVVGEVEALYDCWYNRTSEKCCTVPLTGPCS
jgi:hypothetical protein